MGLFSYYAGFALQFRWYRIFKLLALLSIHSGCHFGYAFHQSYFNMPKAYVPEPL